MINTWYMALMINVLSGIFVKKHFRTSGQGYFRVTSYSEIGESRTMTISKWNSLELCSQNFPKTLWSIGVSTFSSLDEIGLFDVFVIHYPNKAAASYNLIGASRKTCCSFQGFEIKINSATAYHLEFGFGLDTYSNTVTTSLVTTNNHLALPWFFYGSKLW